MTARRGRVPAPARPAPCTVRRETEVHARGRAAGERGGGGELYIAFGYVKPASGTTACIAARVASRAQGRAAVQAACVPCR
jgi:hypothetical protein